MKKKISLATICCIGVVAILAIFALFGLDLDGVVFDIFFTFLTFAGAGILLLGTCEILEENKIPALVSFSLISLSALLVILCFWTTLDDTELYSNITIIVSILSVCTNLIVSSLFKIKKRYIVVQAVAYLSYFVLSFLIILAVLDKVDIDGVIFALFAIISTAMLFVLKVLGKKPAIETNKDGYVTIKKEEYEELLAKKAQLEALLKEEK